MEDLHKNIQSHDESLSIDKKLNQEHTREELLNVNGKLNLSLNEDELYIKKNNDEDKNLNNQSNANVTLEPFNYKNLEKNPNLNLNVKLKNLSLNDRLNKQREAHEHIRKHADNFEKVQEDFLFALSFILKNAKFKIKNINEFINLSFEYDFTNTLKKTLEKSIATLETEVQALAESLAQDTSHAEYFYIPYVITSMTRTFSNYSSKFCVSFQESNGISILSNIIKSNVLLEAHLEVALSLIRNCIGSLINFGRVNSNFMWDYKQANTVESILTCLNKLGNTNSDIGIACFMALAFIVDEDQVVKFESEIRNVIPGIVSIVKKIEKNFKKKSGHIERQRIQLREGDVEESEVAFTDLAGTMWHLVEVLNALYHLAVIDSIKGTIYFENKMSEYLRTIVFHGNNIEIEYSLVLLYQLCFDEKIAQNVCNDGEFYQRIIHLQSSSEDSNIRMMSDCIVWFLGEKNKKKETEHDFEDFNKNKKKETEYNFEDFRFRSKRFDNDGPRINESENLSRNKDSNEKQIKSKKKGDKKNESLINGAKPTVKHIMISYNSESRELCMKIKSELEKMNHKVWIDVNNIHGSSLESMALAIENSMCVLMCMTEKYKQSPNCRAEAEYAFNLHKPIIPLIMQKDFVPKGWLGKDIECCFKNFKNFLN